MLNHGNKRDGAENSSRPKHFGGTAQAISVSEPRTGQHLGTKSNESSDPPTVLGGHSQQVQESIHPAWPQGAKPERRHGSGRPSRRVPFAAALTPPTQNNGRPAITGSQEAVNCIPNLVCSPFMGPGAIDPRCGGFRRDGSGLFFPVFDAERCRFP
ncbi:hypothetical protein BO85DRAFT_264730 [Aspergillus piperis CBS 112811]|uniref:Uncharacterized protein n=1 Tax=Aspergillus piperis CBS 112811 TaxID=1448313 RepID=A0A8G1R4A1_9EURO|nr:hypothetical protein BO85DRAFT_264730 [Aspergillus piperis CBS 112811]RAH59199.1 hypothetical protein BO85DRAFT_264730 [Aspergillus piperis CBS 112811]